MYVQQISPLEACAFAEGMTRQFARVCVSIRACLSVGCGGFQIDFRLGGASGTSATKVRGVSDGTRDENLGVAIAVGEVVHDQGHKRWFRLASGIRKNSLDTACVVACDLVGQGGWARV